MNKEVSALQPYESIGDYAEHLEWYLNYHITGFKQDYPATGDMWLADQTEYIKAIAETDNREICADYLAIGRDGQEMVIRLIGDNPLNHVGEHLLVPWDYRTLIRISDSENWDEMTNSINKKGPVMLYLGYSAIRLIALERLRLDMIKNKTLSALLLRYEKIVMEDPLNAQAVSESYEQLSSFVAQAFYSMARLDSKERSGRTNLEDMNLLMAQVLKKKFPDDVRESMVAAAEGSQAIKKIPEDVTCDLINEYNSGKPKAQKKKEAEPCSPEESSIWQNLYPKKKIVIQEVEEDDPLANIENTILTNQHYSIILEQLKIPRDKEIAKLYLQEQFNGTDIANILNESKSTVYRRLKHIDSLLFKFNV